MKVIKQGKEIDNLPIEIICDECESTLEIEKSDIKYDYLGQASVICPICGNEIYLETFDKDITVNSVEFPDNFYHFGGNSAKFIPSEEIKRYIKGAVDYFRENPNDFSYVIASGDTFIGVYNYQNDEEYEVIVCKNYFQTFILYDEIDRKAAENSHWEKNGVFKKIEN